MSARLVSLAVAVAGGLAALGLVAWWRSRSPPGAEKESAKQALVPAVPNGDELRLPETSRGEPLGLDDVREILGVLEQAARESEQRIMKAAAAGNGPGAEAGDAGLRAQHGVGHIVECLSPISLAQTSLRNDRGVGERELHQAIQFYEGDEEVSRVNAAIKRLQESIKTHSHRLMTGLAAQQQQQQQQQHA